MADPGFVPRDAFGILRGLETSAGSGAELGSNKLMVEDPLFGITHMAAGRRQSLTRRLA